MLTHNEISDEGALFLTMSSWFSNLVHLDLCENLLGNIGSQILSTCNLKNLKWLNLKHNQIGDNGYKCLSESEKMPLL